MKKKKTHEAHTCKDFLVLKILLTLETPSINIHDLSPKRKRKKTSPCSKQVKFIYEELFTDRKSPSAVQRNQMRPNQAE